MTTNELLYGFPGPLPVQTILRAGPFSMVYENGFIRHIRYGKNEILRMIYMALRDKNWGTYAPVIENEKISINKHSFLIHYRCRYIENNNDFFAWDVIIKGDEKGKIIYSIAGTAFADFWKNRAGFCILHPIKNTAGQPLIVTHRDGTAKTDFFPVSIAPQNPFLDIKKLQWRHGQYEYVIETAGDIFEMEDHRNWTDTSYKTFCTPLSLPYPVLLKKGDRVQQQISFYPLTPLPVIEAHADTGLVNVTILDREIKRKPAIGIGNSSEIKLLPASALEAIKRINCDYYYIEVILAGEDWQDELKIQLTIAEELEARLFILLDLGKKYEEEFGAFSKMLVDRKERLQYLLITERDQPVADQQIIEWMEKNVKNIFPSVLLGIGTTANFAELNRNRRTLCKTDFVNYAIHPQEHSFDNLSLIENLESQADTVISAMQIYPGIPVSISPVTLRKRINPYAQTIAERVRTNAQKADPRQISLWAAGWTLASIKHLGEAGALAITYFQTAGKQGICNAGGECYPVGNLLELVLRSKNAWVVKTISDEPLQCTSLLLEDGKKRWLFLASHVNNALRVKLPFHITTIDQVGVFPSQVTRLKVDETDEIELSPWCVMSLSSENLNS